MSNKKLIKPSLNSWVWVKYGNRYLGCSFSKVQVVAKGDEFFVHNEVFDSCKVEDYRVPTYYKDYGTVWFKSLKEIKQSYRLKKIDECNYEAI